MNEDEKHREAERLANEVKSYHGCLTGDCPHEKQSECYDALIFDGVKAGRESNRHIADHWFDRMNIAYKQLKAERERSAELIEKLKAVKWSCENDLGRAVLDLADQAIAEHEEASRDR